MAKEEKQISLKKLKRIELVCGILGLLIGVVAFIFLFVNAIAFTESVTEDVSVTFTTSISRFLGSDFNLYYGDVSVSLWDFCNPRLNTGTIEQTVSIYLVAFAWVVLIGCLLSALFYILYLCKIRLYWLSGFAARMTTIGSIFILLSLILGQISFDGITIYAEGVSYGIVIPILYAILIGGLCIVVSYLLKYSQKRRGILKEMLVKQEMEAAVGMQTLCASNNAAQAPYTANGVIQTPYTVASYSAPVSQAAPTLRAVPASEYGNAAAVGQQTYGTLVNDDAKRAVLVRFRKALTPDDREAFSKQIVALNMHQYQQLIQLPLKKTVVTVLLSIFLGGLGIDRFYVGDVKFGIAKLAVTIVSSILLFVPFLGTFASIANGIWKFVDIFFCYKRGYKKNYENAMGVLRKA